MESKESRLLILRRLRSSRLLRAQTFSLKSQSFLLELRGPVLRDTARLSQRDPPSLRAIWGFWCPNMANWMRYPLPLLSAFAPWRACEVEVRYPPPQRGISEILARYHMKTRQHACETPLCDTISKGHCAIQGVSRTGPLSPNLALKMLGGGVS